MGGSPTSSLNANGPSMPIGVIRLAVSSRYSSKVRGGCPPALHCSTSGCLSAAGGAFWRGIPAQLNPLNRCQSAGPWVAPVVIRNRSTQ